MLRWQLPPSGNRPYLLRLLPLATMAWTVATLPAPAIGPPAKAAAIRFDLRTAYQTVRGLVPNMRTPEIVEMVSAIAGGSRMGPGEGWFHDGQSRYGWQWLAARFDADHDGKITRKEFTGPSDAFERLDRDHDGVLTRSDFDWSERSSFTQRGRPVGYWFRQIDRNSNGRISAEEWQAFFAKAAHGKGYLTVDDLREALPLSPPRPTTPPKNTGPSPLVLALGLLGGELGSFLEGPAVGQPAPDFTLKTHDGKRQIAPAQFRGKKPVVLVFGSFT
jgi:hypothetical protein